jgi:hypothetical protein
LGKKRRKKEWGLLMEKGDEATGGGGWGQHAWRRDGKGRGGREGRREIKKKMFPMNTTTLSSKGTR